ncbi:MAG TPA: lytic murein transglycosylase B [Gammaproteobacteria bacterium]|nr:lytic murein transglycosylase B [Gammaproteobacteria bacterium]
MPLAILLCLLTGCATATVTDDTPKFQSFAQEMATEHDFDQDRVVHLLASSERQQSIIDAISSPAEAMPWSRYRPIFLKEGRIRDGVAFWNEHEALLRRAAQTYGVPPAIIVAIIGVETRYGSHQGHYRVIDALRTLAFDYPPRSAFFRRELKQYLLLTREEGLDPLDPTGSYAGAMGMPQFISSSYRHYAVDFDGDGRRDLWNGTADAVGSVANYFAQHGWQAGRPIAVRASVSGEAWRSLEDDGLEPNTTVAALRAAGVSPSESLPADAPARLTVLKGGDGDEYWVTLKNFYVITRYNHSPLYAMAVYQLARAIEQRRNMAAR